MQRVSGVSERKACFSESSATGEISWEKQTDSKYSKNRLKEKNVNGMDSVWKKNKKLLLATIDVQNLDLPKRSLEKRNRNPQKAKNSEAQNNNLKKNTRKTKQGKHA